MKNLWDPKEIQRGDEGKLPDVFCCWAGGDCGEFDLEEDREKKKFAGSLPSFLAGMAHGLSGFKYDPYLLNT